MYALHLYSKDKGVHDGSICPVELMIDNGSCRGESHFD